MAQQMSFYSAEANHPRVADLAGLLCALGRTDMFARATGRLTMPVAADWRAKALVGECARRGVAAEVRACEETGETRLRTAFRADLASLALAWGAGSGKTVPDRFAVDGAVLRLWVLAAGRWTDGGYLLPLDPDAPGTHEPLADALVRCGLRTTPPSAKADIPGLRVVGRRRLARLLELVGPAAGPGRADHWPAVSRMRAVS